MDAETHAAFQERCINSGLDCMFMKQWFTPILAPYHIRVDVCPVRIAPRHQDRIKYIDHGDLTLTNTDTGEVLYVEIKKKKSAFRSLNYFKHGMKLCRVASHQHKSFTTWAYFTLNNDRTFAAVVFPAQSQHEWETTTYYDAEYETNEIWYKVRPEHITLIDLKAANDLLLA